MRPPAFKKYKIIAAKLLREKKERVIHGLLVFQTPPGDKPAFAVISRGNKLSCNPFDIKHNPARAVLVNSLAKAVFSAFRLTARRI